MSKIAKTLRLLAAEEAGFVVGSELVLMGTILTIGVIAGLVTVRDTVTTELADLGSAIKQVDQSYSFANVETPCGVVAGSVFIDETNFCTPGLSDDFPPTQLPPVVIGQTPSGGEGD